MQIMLGVTPKCTTYGISDWLVPLSDDRLPAEADYAQEDYYPAGHMSNAVVGHPGDTIGVRRVGAGWRLDLLGPDGNWHPVTNFVTDVPPTCILV